MKSLRECIDLTGKPYLLVATSCDKDKFSVVKSIRPVENGESEFVGDERFEEFTLGKNLIKVPWGLPLFVECPPEEYALKYIMRTLKTLATKMGENYISFYDWYYLGHKGEITYFSVEPILFKKTEGLGKFN